MVSSNWLRNQARPQAEAATCLTIYRSFVHRWFEQGSIPAQKARSNVYRVSAYVYTHITITFKAGACCEPLIFFASLNSFFCKDNFFRELHPVFFRSLFPWPHGHPSPFHPASHRRRRRASAVGFGTAVAPTFAAARPSPGSSTGHHGSGPVPERRNDFSQRWCWEKWGRNDVA